MPLSRRQPLNAAGVLPDPSCSSQAPLAAAGGAGLLVPPPLLPSCSCPSCSCSSAGLTAAGGGLTGSGVGAAGGGAAAGAVPLAAGAAAAAAFITRFPLPKSSAGGPAACGLRGHERSGGAAMNHRISLHACVWVWVWGGGGAGGERAGASSTALPPSAPQSRRYTGQHTAVGAQRRGTWDDRKLEAEERPAWRGRGRAWQGGAAALTGVVGEAWGGGVAHGAQGVNVADAAGRSGTRHRLVR